MNFKLYLLASGALLSAMVGTAAYAQTTAVAAASTIEELVVTAERREQSLQDVPLAISAYTSKQRELVGINSIYDMTTFTPGLQYSSQFDRVSLRGVGRTTNAHAADPSVSVYSDGIYETATIEAGKSPLFLERVEVLRGPQATLYGRNAIAGAINLVSKRPTEEPYGEVRASYGNYNHSVLEGAVSGPTTIPGVLFRFAYNWEKQTQGWYDNVVPGQPDEGNIIDTHIVEGQLKFNFGDHFEGWAKLTAMQWNNGGGGPGSRSTWTPSPYGTFQVGASPQTTENPGYGCSGRVTNVVNPSPAGCVNPAATDPRKFASVVPYHAKLAATYIFASDWTWHAQDFDAKYTTGGARYHYELTRPADDTVAPVQQYTLPGGLVIYPQQVYAYQEKEEWWSHELTFTSTGGGPVQWLAGLYYWNEHYQQPASTYVFGQKQVAAPVGASCPRTGSICASNTPLYRTNDLPAFHIQSEAAYAQADWAFAPNFKATLGLRYSHDSKVGSEEGRVICFAYFACTPAAVPGGFATPEITGPLGTPAVDLTQTSLFAPLTGPLPRGVTSNFTYDPATGLARRTYDADWSATTGNLGVQWDPDSETNVYARYSRGYKAGGFRAGYDTVLTSSPFTNAEHLDDIEVGFKKTFGRVFQANIALFHYNYKDAQIPLSVANTSGAITQSQSVFYNIPKAISQGVEIETVWQPIDHLQILANYSYLDSHITESSGPVDPADPAALDPQATPIITFAQCAATPGKCSTDVFTALTGGGYQRGQDLKGQKLPNAPKNKIAVSANYTWLTSMGSLTAGLTYSWRDAQYGSIFNRSYTRSPSWDQWDARLIYKPNGERLTVILYGKNLLDDLGYEGGAVAARRAGFIGPATPGFTEIPVSQGITTSYPITPPRTFGIELQYRFM
jgi:iron complex outermembrane receptor protein